METVRNVLAKVREVLDIRLLDIAGSTVTLGTAVSAVLVVLLTLWMSKLVQRGVRRTLERRGVHSESTIGLIAGLLNYALLAAGIGIALATAGIDVGALFAAGALFAVGLGFALQSIVQNFVSGVILLSERTIRPGDVVGVEGELAKVDKMGIRATLVRDRDGVEKIVPNSILVGSSVKNYTLMSGAYRVEVTVGVAYESDMKLVRQTLEEVVAGLDWRHEGNESRVFLRAFGQGAVEWDVAVWTLDPWNERLLRSWLREAIWEAFRAQRITIAFPQLDVHLDAPVAEGLARIGTAA